MNEDAMNSAPLAIVGIGCLFPKAGDLDSYWANLRDGVDAITEVPATHWNPEDYFDADPSTPDHVYARRGGFLEPVDISPLDLGVAPRDIEATDTTQLLSLHVAAQALKDAGYGPGGKAFDRARASVILGVTGALELVIPLGARLGHPIWKRALRDAGVDQETADDVVERIAEQYVPWQENSFPGLLGNVAAGRIANRLDLHGTNCVVDAACASSLSALHLAALELQTGRADIVLAGGVDTFNDVFMYTCFSKTPALSKNGNARPFDRDADGTILGEGVGIVALKRLDTARRDGDRVYAVLRGIGSSSDGKGQAIYAPSSEGQARALRNAYRIAGVEPQTIGLLEGHGTGTKVGDAIEVGGLTSVFDPDGTVEQPWCALGSVKSMIGHAKAAAGVAGLIKSALALHHRVLPPTLKVEQPNDAVASAASPFSVNPSKRPWLPPAEHPRRAGVSAFGFGGSNFHAVLEEADTAQSAIAWDGRTQLLAFSASTRDALSEQLRAFEVPSTWAALRAQAAVSRASFEGAAACRLTMVLTSSEHEQVQQRVNAAIAALEKDERSRWSLPGGTAFGEGPSQGKVAGLFPGQGAQKVGMLAELACSSPLFLDTVVAGLQANPDVASAIYPLHAFDDTSRETQRKTLTNTAVAQPALGAVSMGAWAVLGEFGVTIDAAVGHSYGELTALCVAGSLPQDALGAVSRRRGELMAQGQGDRGSMLAVFATAEDVQAQLDQHGWKTLVIANRNAPQQQVLSGPTDAIETAERTLADNGLRTHRLDVAAAFHSPLVAAAREPFLATLQEVSLAPPKIPVYANATGKPYPSDAPGISALLADQLVSSVRFVGCIEAMVADGVDTFVEVGPGRSLAGLVSAIAGEAVRVVSIDASGGRRSTISDLASCIGALAAWGHEVRLVDWDPVDASVEAQPGKKKLTISVCGANAKPKVSTRAARKPVRSAVKTMTTESTRPLPVPVSPVAVSPVAVSPAVVVPPPVAPPVPQANAALQAAQVNLAALMRLQEQTAELHRRFLEGQQHATQAFGTLVAQQQALLGGGGAVAPQPVALAPQLVAPAPQPVAPAPQPVAPVPQPAAVVAPPVAATSTPVAAAPVVVPQPVAATPTAPQPVASDGTAVAAVLLELVATKTGYPVEMLELSMGLDADLGIDSIKRVEILSGLRERLPDAKPIGPEQLGQLQTLGHIVEYLVGDAGSSPESSSAEPTVAPSTPPTVAPSTRIAEVLLSVVAEKTGYPTEMLELSMGLDADLGIDSIKRVEILSVLRERLPDAPPIGPEQLGTLSTLGHIVDFLGGSAVAVATPSPTLPKPESKSPVAAVASTAVVAPLDRYEVRWCEGLPVSSPVTPPSGTIVVTGADDLVGRIAESLSKQGLTAQTHEWGQPLPSAFGGLVIAVPVTPDDAFVRAAFTMVRGAAPQLRAKGALLLTVSRMGGDFGTTGVEPNLAPRGGALAGLVKTLAHEWPDTVSRAIDLPVEASEMAVDAVIGAALQGGPAEIGYTDRLGTPRLTLASTQGEGVRLGGDDVVLITGGARGVTAAVAIALARAGRPRLVLMGRSPAPAAEPQWLAAAADAAEIKRVLLQQATGRLSPKELAEQCRKVVSAREIAATVRTIEAIGATVQYRSVDVRDAAAVRELVEQTTADLGPVTALVHGAGVLADKHFVDKSDDDFDRVYGTKVEGADNLLAALSDAPLRAVVMFSSSTARFGRRGQSDYAMANEVLNKLAQRLRCDRPGVRTVSVGWGPWDGGMVTPALAAIFRDEGVGTIGLQDGATLLVNELAGGGPAEIIVVGGGTRFEATADNVPTEPQVSPERPTIFEREVSVADHPFLASHVLGGKAVLPTVMMLEWLAHAALAEHPGLRFVGVDDLRIFKGIRLGASDRLKVRVEAGSSSKRDGQFMVPVALCSGGTNGHRVVHAQGEVVMATQADVAPQADLPRLPAFAEPMDSVYTRRLFHGEAFRGIQTIDGLAADGIVATTRAAPKPKEWMNAPVRRHWITDPLAVDSGLQAVIVWTSAHAGAASLPNRLGRYRQFEAFPEAGARIGVRVTRRGDHRAVAELDWVDENGRLIARLTDCEYTLDAGLTAAFVRNRVE